MNEREREEEREREREIESERVAAIAREVQNNNDDKYKTMFYCQRQRHLSVRKQDKYVFVQYKFTYIS